MRKSEIRNHLKNIKESAEAVKEYVPYSNQLINYTTQAIASIDVYGYQIEFIKNLPQFFTKSDGNLISETLEMREDTFWRYVRTLCKQGWLKRSGQTWKVQRTKF
jgi:hypothetical protein